jgi:putative transposase
MTSKRRKKHKPEQIVAKLRDALAAARREGPGSSAAGPGDQRGNADPLAGRAPPRSGGLGGMRSEEAKRLKALEDENRRLKQLVADQALDIQRPEHLSEGNW